MQGAQAVLREVLERAGDGLELAVGQPDGDRVDAEVAAREVLGDRRAELDVGQRTRMRVALAPRRGEVDGAGRVRGPEALVDDRAVAEPLRGGRRVALHHEIEVARVAPEQRVADRAAHHPDARQVRQGVEHGRRAGHLPQPLEQIRRHVPATIAAHVVAG